MPHLLLSNFSIPSTPAQIGEVKFLFYAPPFLGVEIEKVRFLLQLKEYRKGKGGYPLYLLKYEKRTRPLLKLLVKAYSSFLQWSGAKVERENISGIKDKKLSPFLVTIWEDFSNIDILEIGFGTGRHLLQLAREYPDRTILGVEIYPRAIQQVLRRLEVEQIKNVRIINYDGRLLLERIPPNQLEQIYLHFPLPWEENREKRIVNLSFLKEIQRILKPGGFFYLRTDSPVYRDWTIEQLLELPFVEFTVKKNFTYKIVSKYEERWRRLNRNIFDIIVKNWEEGGRPVQNYQFQFKGKLEGIKPELIKGKRFLIHIERIYPMREGGELIKLAMGAYERVEGLFIVNSPTGSYYFKPPAPVEENWLAHQQLKRIYRCP